MPNKKAWVQTWSTFVFISITCVFAIGCGYLVVETSDPHARDKDGQLLPSGSTERKVIDVGVVLAEEPTYRCIPLHRLAGLVGDRAILNVSTSCDCIRPSIIEYATPSGLSERGLRVDFIPENRTTELRPVSLSVEILVELENDETSTVVIDFLHTNPIEGEQH